MCVKAGAVDAAEEEEKGARGRDTNHVDQRLTLMRDIIRSDEANVTHN
jgi:hypothetical protein